MKRAGESYCQSGSLRRKALNADVHAPSRDLLYAVVAVALLFALPPLFKFGGHRPQPEILMLREISILPGQLPTPPPPSPDEVPPPPVETQAPILPLTMPGAASASPSLIPLQLEWNSRLPTVPASDGAAFPVQDFSPGELIFEQDEVAQPPRPVWQPQPNYPMGAKRAGIEGFVEIEAVVMSDGSVDHIRILRENPLGTFSQSAQNAVASWKFEAARHQGQAVNSRIRVTLEFRLK